MSRFSTFGKATATVVAMGAALSAALTAPAAAASYTCADAHLCLYKGLVGKGGKLSVRGGVRDLGTVRFDDTARSAFNGTSEEWCVYQDKNYKGNWLVLEPGEAGNLTGESGRAVSSLRPQPARGC